MFLDALLPENPAQLETTFSIYLNFKDKQLMGEFIDEVLHAVILLDEPNRHTYLIRLTQAFEGFHRILANKDAVPAMFINAPFVARKPIIDVVENTINLLQTVCKNYASYDFAALLAHINSLEDIPQDTSVDIPSLAQILLNGICSETE